MEIASADLAARPKRTCRRTARTSAVASSGDAPVLACHWDFGDGSSMDGMKVTHTFTHAGDYTVQVLTTGLGAATTRKTLSVSVSGEVSTLFDQTKKQRPQ